MPHPYVRIWPASSQKANRRQKSRFPNIAVFSFFIIDKIPTNDKFEKTDIMQKEILHALTVIIIP